MFLRMLGEWSTWVFVLILIYLLWFKGDVTKSLAGSGFGFIDKTILELQGR